MRRIDITRDGNLDTVAYEVGNLFFFVQNYSDLTEDEAKRLAKGEEPSEVFGDGLADSEWEIIETEINSWEYERLNSDEIRSLFAHLGLDVGDRFIEIFMESLSRGYTMRFGGKDLVINENGDEIYKNVWESEPTQAHEFLLELERGEGPNFERLLWLIEAWARHALTSYDELVKTCGTKEEVKELRDKKTKEGMEKLFKLNDNFVKDYQNIKKLVK